MSQANDKAKAFISPKQIIRLLVLWGKLQNQFPRFPDEIMAETVMCFLSNELESYLLIDVTGFHENVVGPEHQFLVATASSEAYTFLNKASAQPQAACLGFDQQETEFGNRVAALHNKYRADNFPIHLRNPA